MGSSGDQHNTSNVGVVEPGDWLEKQRCQSSVFQLRMSLEAILKEGCVLGVVILHSHALQARI